jgi:hypothetical protein
MATTKVSSTQTKNEGLPKILKIDFNNGTGTRSTTTSATLATIPGAIGDTSYTAPADTNVDILFTMTQMILQSTSGICRVYLNINGVDYGPGMYIDIVDKWVNYTCTYKYSLDAGQTITIGARWNASSGTSNITNNNTDSGFPNEITGLVIPRPS